MCKQEVLLPTKPPSDVDTGFRHVFRAKASLPLTQSVPAVPRDDTRLYWFSSLFVNSISILIHLEPYLVSFLVNIFPLV